MHSHTKPQAPKWHEKQPDGTFEQYPHLAFAPVWVRIGDATTPVPACYLPNGDFITIDLQSVTLGNCVNAWHPAIPPK